MYGIANAVTKSANNNLKNLGFTPNDFKGFKPSTISYDVTVPSSTNQINIYAKPADSKATVTGTGTKELENGVNEFNIVVTAENGAEKTYTLNVTKQSDMAEGSTQNTIQTETASQTNSDITKIEVSNYSITPQFSPDIYEYKLNINGDINDLDIITQKANEDVDIEVVGNTGLQEGENTITILVYNKKTKENSTYQIIVNKTNIDIEGVSNTLNEAREKANKIRYIIFGVLIFIAVCTVLYIILKLCSHSDEEDLYEYDDEDKRKMSRSLDFDQDIEETNKMLFRKVNKDEFKKPQEEVTSVSSSIEKDEMLENKENEIEALPKNKRKGKHF